MSDYYYNAYIDTYIDSYVIIVVDYVSLYMPFIIARMIYWYIICENIELRMWCGELWMIPHMLNYTSHLIWYDKHVLLHCVYV